MRRTQSLAAANPLLLALLLATSQLQPVNAFPYPLQNVNGENHGAGLRYLLPRQCVQRCGMTGQYCCDSDTECFTSANIAGCSARGGDSWGAWVTTWTETKTFTSTITTHWPQPTQGADDTTWGDCDPDLTKGESACGRYCCADYQVCVAWDSQCGPRDGWPQPGGGGGGGDGGGQVTTITQGGQVITTQFSAPYRQTGTGFSTATNTQSTGAATGTAIGSDGSNGEEPEGTGGGLSAGAIAGIVIGVLAGLFLLGLICFCCIVRGIWGLLCGGRKKEERRERVEVVEERYRGGSRAPSAAAHTHREKHTGWFGRPSSAGARRDEKDKSSGAKWLGLGAAAATLLALLNIGRDKKPERKPRSRYTDSYYSYSDPSGSSAGGRSHHTRGTRRSERAESRYTGRG